jgi:CAAX prenyl protease-like protein
MPGANIANMSISPATARIVPFAVFMAFVLAGSLLFDSPELLGNWDARHLFTIRAFVVMALLVLLWRRYAELRDTGPSWRQVSIAIVSGFAVFVLWINLDFPWATFGETTVFDPARADGGIDWTLVEFRMLGLAVVVPVMEELFWRSFMMRWIDHRDFLELPPEKVSWRAIVVSSVLFASEHQLWLAGLIAGFVYAMLYVRSGNLWVPVISHVVTNAVLGAWILETGNWRFW